MKKIFRNIGIVAFGFCMAVSFAACHSGDDSQPAPSGELDLGDDDVITPTENTLTLTTNVLPTKLTLDGNDITGDCTITQNADGTYTVTYTTSGNGGTLTVEAGDSYLPQTMNLTFGADKTTNSTINFVAKSTETKTIDEMLNPEAGETSVTVTNDNSNQTTVADNTDDTTTNVEASITVDSGTELKNEDGSDWTDDEATFSITAYVPPMEADEEQQQAVDNTTEEGVNETDAPGEVPVMAVSCTPDGVHFTKPVTITLTIPGAEDGFNFTCINSDDPNETVNTDVNGKAVSAQIEHFSDWIFKVQSNLSRVAVQTLTTATGSRDNIEDRNTTERFTYNKYTGIEIRSESDKLSTSAQWLVDTYLKSQFGVTKTSPTVSSKTATLTVGAMTRLNYSITQEYKDVTFEFSRIGKTPYVVVVRVYGNVRSNVLRTPIVIEEHIGGSSN